MGNEIPGSQNLAEIAEDLQRYNESLPKLITIMGEMAKTSKAASKINIGEFRKSLSNTKDLVRLVGNFVHNMSDAMKTLGEVNALNLGEWDKIRDMLISKEMYQNPEGLASESDPMGNMKKYGTIKIPGLFDIFAQIGNLTNVMNSLPFVNPVKFKIRFQHTLRLFKSQYGSLVKLTSSFKPEDIKLIQESVDGLQEVLMFLPATVAGMSDVFTKYGKPAKMLLIHTGMRTLLGKDLDGTGGLVWGMLLLGEQLNSKTLDPDSVKDFEKSSKTLTSALNSIIFTVSLAAIAGPIMKIGLAVLFGSKGNRGVIRLMITGLEWVAQKSKDIKDASKSLLYVALCVGILALTAAVMVMVGALVVANLASIGVVIIYLGVLILAFWLVGQASGAIRQGGRELFYIAATVGILAMTAVVMAFLGQFIKANWEGMLCTITYMGALVLAFIVIGLAANWINSGAKELFYIAATVGILALIAVVMVFLGQYLEANWEYVKSISLLLFALAGIFIGIGFAAKQMEGSKKSMILIIIMLAMTAVVVYIFTDCAGQLKQLGSKKELYILIGIMSAMILGIAGLAIGLGALTLTGFGGAALNAGLIAIGVIAAVILAIAIAMKVMVDAVKAASEIKEEPAVLIEKMSIPFSVAMGLIGYVMAIPPGVTTIAAYRVACLSSIVRSVGRMADTMQHIASLNMPDPDKGWDKDGRPLGWKQMETSDFLGAAINGGTILSFWVDMFGDAPVEREVMMDGQAVKVTIKPVDQQTLDKISGSTKRKIKKLAKIVSYVGKMADVMQHIASLNMPDAEAGYDESGNPKGWKLMDTTDFVAAAVNGGTILSFFANLFGDDPVDITVMKDGQESKSQFAPVSEDILEKVTGRTKRKVKKLGVIVGVVGNMAETLQNMSSLVIPDAHTAEDFDENGRPKAWKQMTGDDLMNAALTAGSLLSFFVHLWGDEDVTLNLGALGQVPVKVISEDALDNITGRTKRKVKKLGEIIGVVSNISEILKNLSSLIIPDAHGPEDFDENGNPKKWKQMTNKDVKGAMDQAAYLMRSCIEVLGDEKLADELSNLSKNKMKKLGLAMEAVQGLSGIMEIVKGLAGGNFPIEYKRDNDKESPTYGQQIVSKTINLVKYIRNNQYSIKETIKALIMCPIKAVGSILDDKDAMKQVKKVKNDGQSVVDAINKVKSPITSIMDTYNNKLAGVDVEEVQKMYTTILQSSIMPLTVFDPKVMRDVKYGSLIVFERVAKSMTTLNFDVKKAETLKANIQEMSSLMKTINTVDLQKLKTAEQAMHHIAYLTKSIHGDFQGLAKVLSEELLEVLNKLTDALNGLGDAKQPATIGDATPDKGGTAGQADKAKNDQKSEKLQAMNEIRQQLGKIATSLSTLAGTVHYGAVTATKKFGSN